MHIDASPTQNCSSRPLCEHDPHKYVVGNNTNIFRSKPPIKDPRVTMKANESKLSESGPVFVIRWLVWKLLAKNRTPLLPIGSFAGNRPSGFLSSGECFINCHSLSSYRKPFFWCLMALVGCGWLV